VRFLVTFGLLFTGETARAGGWLTRAERLLDQRGDCVERGFLLVPNAYRCWDDGDPATAHAIFTQATEIDERYGEPDLITLVGLGRGQTLIALAKTAEGVAALDEAMVAVTADEVSPVVVGLVYCAVIDSCRQRTNHADPRRERASTSASSPR
jgi:hypothetical protein